MAKLLLGGILAAVLLGLYIASIVIGIQTTRKCGLTTSTIAQKVKDGAKLEEAIKGPCSDEEKNLGNISYLLNLLGGLISATVVAVLAATHASDLPAKDFFKAGLGSFAQGIAAYVPLVYILTWTFCGLFVVIFGLMVYGNDPSPPLTAHAKTWLGTAVAAIYAYIGITPEETPARPAIAGVAIAPVSIALNSADPTEQLKVKATDSQNKAIANLPSDRFVWKSSNNDIAKVDKTGLVTRVASGTCIVTATANTVVSNECAVTCS